MNQTGTALPVLTSGIDLGDEQSAFCVLEADGQILEEGKVPTNRVAFVDRFGTYPVGRVVIEACAHSLWASRSLSALGHEVIIANPRQLHLISKSERKGDRNNARNADLYPVSSLCAENCGESFSMIKVKVMAPIPSKQGGELLEPPPPKARGRVGRRMAAERGGRATVASASPRCPA